MHLQNVKNKIDCCFAKEVYSKYLQNRFGIDGCVDIDSREINNLNILYKTFNYFHESLMCNNRLDINTGRTKITSGDCNISNLIEKINLI